MIAILLNGIWSILALCAAIISIPYKIQVHRKPFALIISVRSFWWRRIKRVRASAIGSVVLCGPLLEDNDIEHELIHIEQHYRQPFVYPFLNFYQTKKYGYRNNIYEIEAYDRSGSVYTGSEVVKRKHK